MSRISSLINFFNHPNKSLVENQVRTLTQHFHHLRDKNIEVLHTPVVLPLGTSNEIGGYARSIGFSFGPKLIALNVERFLEENPSMQKFILLRQISQFYKNSRCLHIPLAAVAVGVSTLASTILFSASLTTAVAISAMVALLSATIISCRECNNELNADKKAFSHLDMSEKLEVLASMREKILQNSQKRASSDIINAICRYIFNSDSEVVFSLYSGYPPLRERHCLLFSQCGIDAMRGLAASRAPRGTFPTRASTAIPAPAPAAS